MVYFLAFLCTVIAGNSLESYKYKVRRAFYHAFDSYMKTAFPMDELNPITCEGRGRDYLNPRNTVVNDVLGEFALTLIDSMDTLAIMGDKDKFHDSVRLVSKFVDFGRHANKVQLFEVNIRIIGGLLSSHLLISDPKSPVALSGYDGKLLDMAYDLGKRLLPAFQTNTGIPYARVNLVDGIPEKEINSTCTAAAGSLIIEFGILSRLTGNPIFENSARRAFMEIWRRRSKVDLVGNVIDVQTGKWLEPDCSIGAGIDSFYEYALKAYILFGDQDYLDVFETSYHSIMTFIKDAKGFFYRVVRMDTGTTMTNWVDSLSAFFPGLQVLYGDLPRAARLYEVYYSLWNKYGAIPERWDVIQRSPVLPRYPLRPELMESTYMLYTATKDDYYINAGAQIMADIDKFCRTNCGYATLADIATKTKEDRMESFFLAETLKYAYLLFDKNNFIHDIKYPYVFNTEGHILYIPEESKLIMNSSLFGGRGVCKKWVPTVSIGASPVSTFSDELKKIMG